MDEPPTERDAGALLGAREALSTYILQRWVSDKSLRAVAGGFTGKKIVIRHEFRRVTHRQSRERCDLAADGGSYFSTGHDPARR